MNPVQMDTNMIQEATVWDLGKGSVGKAPECLQGKHENGSSSCQSHMKAQVWRHTPIIPACRRQGQEDPGLRLVAR